jgi:hypothetical protein
MARTEAYREVEQLRAILQITACPNGLRVRFPELAA